MELGLAIRTMIPADGNQLNNLPENQSENVAAGVPPAVEAGILSTLRSLATEDGPPGKTVRLAETPDVSRLIARRRCFRRAGRTGSTSAKMADATIFKHALKGGKTDWQYF
jgi:hypothetical protein